MSRSLRLVLPVAALALVVGCSDTEPFVPKIYSTNFAASLGVDLANSTRHPAGLYYRDITVGGGVLVPDDTVKSVTVAYVGAFRNAKEFDNGTITFTTDAGNIIDGMKLGVQGMRIGGVRQLIIPPALGYGSNPVTGIPTNAILVFEVTLLNVTVP